MNIIMRVCILFSVACVESNTAEMETEVDQAVTVDPPVSVSRSTRPQGRFVWF